MPDNEVNRSEELFTSLSCSGLWFWDVVWWGLDWLRGVVDLVVPGALT